MLKKNNPTKWTGLNLNEALQNIDFLKYKISKQAIEVDFIVKL